jgi:alpha-mannosidase
MPLIVYNSLNWERVETISWEIPGDIALNGQVLDEAGHLVPTQIDKQSRTLRFWSLAPSIGYQVFWYAAMPQHINAAPPQQWVLENEFLRVEICPETGNVISIRDLAAQCEVLSGDGNRLQFFQDKGQYWDAWNIDPNYAQHPLEETELQSIHWMSWGPVQQRIRVVRQWRHSQFSQEYVLDLRSPLLKIETQVNWQETHVLVKAAFPLRISAEFATYETPCGAIERPTLPNPNPLTDHQKAKWEVPALHWADLTQPTEDAYGVSLLNDCKYGYDAQPNGLRLTLLRSPLWPDPTCDRGLHSFTYALYLHSGGWQQAKTHQKGYELNRPLIAQSLELSNTESGKPNLSQSFFSGFADNLVLMAFKQSEDSPDHWIMRCYEAIGQSAKARFQSTLPLEPLDVVDGLERSVTVGNEMMRGWEVRSQRWG